MHTYQSIKSGKRKAKNKNLEVNGLKIQEMQERDNYRYLGIDESLGIDGPLNKKDINQELTLPVPSL